MGAAVSLRLLAAALLATAATAETRTFDLSTPSPATQPYSAERGFGIVAGDPLAASVFVFSLQVPEGNYRVRLELTAAAVGHAITVKTESRRLTIDRRVVTADRPPLEALVNVRTPALADGGTVALNPREIGVWHWNDRLDLEIHAPPGSVAAITVAPAVEPITVYLAGDSTVTDQPEEPWIGWGQMLPLFFGPGVVVANHAESGLALSSFFAHRRFDKILESIRPGDYLFVQFGHNDMKERGEGIGPWTSYRDALRRVVDEVRARGAHPVLLTSMQRRRFDDEFRQFATLGDFPLVVRRVAAERAVPLIDLNQISATLYAALGPEGSKRAFVHYPAGSFPGQERALRDDTHFNAYGGYQLARGIVEGIRLEVPALAARLRDDLAPFDPARPEPFESVDIPPSPGGSITRPLGD